MLFGAIGIGLGLYIVFGRAMRMLVTVMPKGLIRAVGAPAIGLLSVLMGIGGAVHPWRHQSGQVCRCSLQDGHHDALAHRTDPKPLKCGFGVFLMLMGLNMLRKVYFG